MGLFLLIATHQPGGAEAGDADASTVMAVKVEAIEGSTQPEVDAWDPHQNRVLETLGQVRVGRIPRSVPILQ